MIPYSRQNINKKDVLEVTKVLKSDFLTQGKKVVEFERVVTKISNAKFGVAANSASSALHLGCLALGIKTNDLVWTVPNTFAASANCAINCGASVDFVDIDKDTWNISIDKLKEKLIKAKKKKKLPKLVIPVHFAGQVSEQKKIWELSKKYKFKILEDASHSIGASHRKEKSGSCKWSDITVFSFHPVKIITTGEGGMALTNNPVYAEKMRIFRTNGITQKNFSIKKNKNKPWYYEHQNFGYNYRMNDISAALGISQVKRIKKFIKTRNQIAKKYKKILKNYPIKFQKIEKYNYSSYHLLPIQFDLKKTKKNYLSIFRKLKSKNFHINLHYMPLHLSPYFKKQGFKKGDFKNSEDYANTSMSIPIYYGLKNFQILRITNLIKSFFNEKTR